MKKVDISGMKRLRSINLRIGYAVAIFLAIVAFNWTIERPPLPDFDSEYPLDEAEVKIRRTTQPTPASKPPPSSFNVANKIVEVPDVVFSTTPVSIPVDPTLVTEPPSIFTEPVTEPVRTVLPKPKEPEAAPIFKIVEEMPRFPGCEDAVLTKKEKQDCATNRLLQFLSQNIRYPSIARDNGIEGTVVVRFVVERDGSISNAEVVREIGGGCGAEALRVVKSMPQWRAGMQQGRAVRVQFNLPVNFRLD
jgi:periplasmic protein TonB